MFYWSIWSLVILLPFLCGMWTDRGSLLYVAGVAFAALVVLSAFSKHRSRGGSWLGSVTLFAVVNGALALFLSPWLLAAIYASILIVYFLRFSGMTNAPKNMEGANGAKGCFDRPEGTGEGVPRRNTFRGGIG
jgi:hypothetical protein